MEEYRQWLEQQIERCLNDKDLQREHWAFCKAYEKFTALRQPIVSGSLPSVDEAGVMAVKISEMVEPPLTAQEQSFFIAGFCECVKWLGSNDR